MDMEIHLCRQQRYCHKCAQVTSTVWHPLYDIQRTVFYLILSSFPTPPPQAGIQLKWVMNWLPLMWMVNISSSALQSLLVNIYRDRGILSYLRKSIYLFSQIQRRNGREEIVKTYKDIRLWRVLWRHQMVKEKVIYKRNWVVLMNTLMKI